MADAKGRARALRFKFKFDSLRGHSQILRFQNTALQADPIIVVNGSSDDDLGSDESNYNQIQVE